MMLIKNIIFLLFLLFLQACGEQKNQLPTTPECRLNSDCQAGFSCQENQCVLNQEECIDDCPCQNNTDCLDAERCEVESSQCVARECYNDQDCALEYVCLEGKCEIDTEADRDRDSVPDAIDLCPLVADAMQENHDDDTLGDACDNDDDNDGVDDGIDNCVFVKNRYQGDANADGIGNACDLDVKGTDLIGKLNALEIQLGNYTNASLEIEGNPSVAVIQDDGVFKFEQAIIDMPNVVLNIHFKGYQSKKERITVDLQQEVYDLGNIDLMPIKVDINGKVEKELSQKNDNVMVSALVDLQTVDQGLSDIEGVFHLSAYPIDQKLRLNAQGYVPLEIALSWNEGNQRFEVLDENQELKGLSEFTIQLKRDMSSAMVGEIHTDILGFEYDLIGFKLIELSTSLEREVGVSANGSFMVDGLAQGLYRMEINARGHVLIREMLQIQEGVNQLGVITLTPQVAGEEAYLLQSKVLLNGRDQHDGIQVRALINQQSQASDISALDGTYALRLNRLNHILSFYKEGYESQTLEIVWDEMGGRFNALYNGVVTDISEMQIVLNEQSNASLRFALISDIAGFDWTTKCVVNLQNLSTNQSRQVNPNSVGIVDIRDLNMGIYQVEVLAQGHLPYIKALSLNDGLNDMGEITLTTQVVAQEAYLLQSKVLLNGRDQHDGVQVRALINQQSQASDISALDGTYALRLNRLNHVLSFYKEGYVSKTLEIVWDEMGGRFNTMINGNITDVSGLSVSLLQDDGPNGDLDRDGIVNGIDNCVYVVNTDQIDTDGDRDGNECDDDDDQDGIDDITELLIASNPLNIDSDGDGIDDFKELVVFHTSLLLADSDGDGEGDSVEIGNDLDHPLDTDGDRVIDALESSIIDSDRDGANDEIDGPSDIGDLDGDGVLNGVDNCVLMKNVSQNNLDRDEYGDECDDDDDGDQVIDALDNCPRIVNPTQRDTDVDAIGDECDDDDDNDGLVDLIDPYPLLVDFDRDGILDGDGQNAVDNCPGIANVDQRDNDRDDEGDECDDDDDNDGVLDEVDNCQFVVNANQLNSEAFADAFGDACDLDDDNDGILDVNDNCSLIVNPIQLDLDLDGQGNECDLDDDNDGVLDVNDNCPTVRNADQADVNGDGVGNACAQDVDGDLIADAIDNCVVIPNTDQRNRDNDRFGDACDDEIDGDGYLNVQDNCVFVYNNPQTDIDGDLIGDPCDDDDDNDGVLDQLDSCPRQANLNQDADGDNIDRICDNCPFVDNRYQTDMDKDGQGDECDPDDDNDGLNDQVDNCPKIANFAQTDINQDGVGDACEITFEWYMSDEFPVTDTAELDNFLYIATNGGGIIKVNQTNVNSNRAHYTVGDGLPNNDILRIAVANNGNLWAQTSAGLSIRYASNGAWDTETIGTVNCGSGNVNINYATAIDLDVNKVNGDVYLAYADKIIKKQGNLLSCYPRSAGILNATINSVDISPDGLEMWVGTAMGASKYTESNGWMSYIDGQLGFAVVKQVGFLLENNTWSAIVMNDVIANPKGTKIDASGNVVGIFKNINTPLASYHYTESSLGSKGKNVALSTVFPKITGIPALDLKMIRKNDDTVLFTARNGTTNILKQFSNGKMIATNPNYLSGNASALGVINNIWFNGDGSYYIASETGLYSSFNNFVYTTASGLSSNSIKDIVVDQVGTLWIATNGLISVFKNGLFSTLNNGLVIDKLLLTDDNVVLGMNLGYIDQIDTGVSKTLLADYKIQIVANSSIPLYKNTSLIKDEYGEIYSINSYGIWKKNQNIFENISNNFNINHRYREMGNSLDYLLNNRFVSTNNQRIYLVYANDSQKNIDIKGNRSINAFVIRKSIGTELWLSLKGGFIKVNGWENPYLDGQLSGMGAEYEMPTYQGDPVELIQMPNKDYALSKTEVTVEQYKLCVDFGACSLPSTFDGCNWGIIGREKHPINCVDWYQSRTYSHQWIGGELPTEEQWYYAATGGQNIEYPWGNAVPTCQLANYVGCVGRTAPVCSTIGGNTAQGLCDMGGNVWEWNFDLYDSTISADRVSRGGSWFNGASDLRSASRNAPSPSYRDNYRGFRVARSVH